MLSVPAPVTAAALEGKGPPIVRAFKSIFSATPPAHAGTYPADTSHGRAQVGIVTDNYLHRFRLYWNGSAYADLQHYRIPLASITTQSHWNDTSWTNIGWTPAGIMTYAAFQKGDDLVIVWRYSDSTYVYYKYSTDEGANWSAEQTYYSGASDYASIGGIDLFGIAIVNATLNKFITVGWNDLLHNWTGSTSIFTPNGIAQEIAGTYVDSLLILLYITELDGMRTLQSYEILAGTVNPLLLSQDISELSLSYCDSLFWISFYKDTRYYVYSSPALETLQFALTGLDTPLVYFDGALYYWAPNSEQYAKTATETVSDGDQLPDVLSYTFSKTGVRIEFLEEPDLAPTDYVHLRRGLLVSGETEADCLIPSQPFAFSRLEDTTFTGQALPERKISGIPASMRLKAMATLIMQQCGLPSFEYPTSFVDFLYSAQNDRIFENVQLRTAIDSLCSAYALLFAPRATGHRLINLDTTSDDLEYFFEPIEQWTLTTLTPGLVLFTYSDENYIATLETIQIDPTLPGIEFHSLPFKHSADTQTPPLARLYHHTRTGIRILRTRPLLPLEVGDTLNFDGGDYRLALDIKETFKKGSSPEWKQTIYLAQA